MAKGGIEARWRARDGLIQLAQLTSRAIERRDPARAAGAGGCAGRALGRHWIGPAEDGSSGLRCLRQLLLAPGAAWPPGALPYWPLCSSTRLFGTLCTPR